jgi:hypothetical protein
MKGQFLSTEVQVQSAEIHLARRGLEAQRVAEGERKDGE